MPRTEGLENTDMGVNREHSTSTGVLNLTGCDMFQSTCYYGAHCADEGERESLLSLRVDSA